MQQIKIARMKKLALITFILISFSTYSQDWDFEKPNYEKIEKNIQEKESNLFYKSLMDRYLKADSTLGLEEKRHLYYGYIFNKNYEPYFRSNYGDSLRVVLQKESMDSIDLRTIVRFTDSILTKNPFELNAINYQLYSLEQMGNRELFDHRIVQMRIIVDALMSSGNGKTKEEAFYVIFTSHEYAILNLLGFQFGGSQSLIEHYDYLTVAENEAEIEGFYFDVSPCLNSMSKMFED
jgi:hypothetical protein